MLIDPTNEASSFGEMVGPKVEVLVAESSSYQTSTAGHAGDHATDHDNQESYIGVVDPETLVNIVEQ